MKSNIRSAARWLVLSGAVVGAVVLTGCVAYPAGYSEGYTYGGGYGGYADPYYTNPTVVSPVYIGGTYYEDRRGYRGDRNYDPRYDPRYSQRARPAPDRGGRPGADDRPPRQDGVGPSGPPRPPNNRLPSRPMPQPRQPDPGIP